MVRANTMTHARSGGQIRAASAINLILGLWLVIAAFSVTVSEEAYWNDLIVGILVLILAGTRLSKPTEGTKPASWINAAIGVWLIAAPFILSYEAAQDMWNDIIVGALLLIFAGWSALLPRESESVYAPGAGTVTDSALPPAGTARRDTAAVPPTGTTRHDTAVPPTGTTRRDTPVPPAGATRHGDVDTTVRPGGKRRR